MAVEISVSDMRGHQRRHPDSRVPFEAHGIRNEHFPRFEWFPGRLRPQERAFLLQSCGTDHGLPLRKYRIEIALHDRGQRRHNSSRYHYAARAVECVPASREKSANSGLSRRTKSANGIRIVSM